MFEIERKGVVVVTLFAPGGDEAWVAVVPSVDDFREEGKVVKVEISTVAIDEMVGIPEDCEEIECGAGLSSVGVLAPEKGIDTSVIFPTGELELVVIITVKSSPTFPLGPKNVECVLVAGLGYPSVVE